MIWGGGYVWEKLERIVVREGDGQERREGKGKGYAGGVDIAIRASLLTSFPCRTQPHGPDNEFPRVPIHGVGRVVGGGEGHIERFVPRLGFLGNGAAC